MTSHNQLQPMDGRSIRMPDGTRREVLLQRSWWACLDWMVDVRGESLDDIAGFCHRHLEANPEDELPAVLEYYLHRYMTDHRAATDSIANENFIDPGHLAGSKGQ